MVLACVLRLDFKITVAPLAGELYLLRGFILKKRRVLSILALKKDSMVV